MVRTPTDHSGDLVAAGIDAREVIDLADRTLAEDLDGGIDVTTVATVPPEQLSVLDFVSRANGVVAGLPVAAVVLERAGDVEVTLAATDGDTVEPGRLVLSAVGPTHSLLTAERSALNLLGHLSGVATATAAWARALAGTTAEVRDTRKTTPGLRRLERYAVRCGGGVNHRMSLSDAALVKDNHVIAAGGVGPAFRAVRERFPGLPVEIEVDSLAQLAEALEAGADVVLLDNFTPDQMREAVALNAGRAILEASGGLTLADASTVGATGVDYIAVGALTHSAPVLDIGADLREV
ncbi:MAG: carboxylating nicotinate-nucleotide diphosphorylase [Actinobacteria bacterium]|nr:carboxylating nicotinate-nucleotide diphosphorylase [Actinomycetota bacterium]MCB9411344.1 carboxylating nicotinate-nucleotide diphosphorylase [Actinomycetota bacterium]